MQLPNRPDHARHDATLIAGHAAGDLSASERARADSWLAECAACAELRRDLVAIAAATRSLPVPATLERDLRLSPDQADRLRRGSWLRNFLRPFGAAGSPLRPMATAFTSLGIVGLVVGVTLSSTLSLAGGAATGVGLERADFPVPAAATSAAAAQGGEISNEDGSVRPAVRSSAGVDALYATGDPRDLATAKADGQASETQAAFGPVGGVGSSAENAGDRDLEVEAPMFRPTTPNLLISASIALLGLGLLLFGLRIASRRVR
jgi:hypothetical protein